MGQHVLQIEKFPMLNGDVLLVVSGEERIISENDKTTLVREPGSLRLT